MPESTLSDEAVGCAQGGADSLDLRVVHRTPGRMRFRISRLKDDLYFREALKCLLRSKKGVVDVRVNEACASLVVSFKPDLFDPEQFLQSVTPADLLSAEIPMKDKSKKRLKKNPVYKMVQKLDLLISPSLQAGIGAIALGAAVIGAPSLITRAALTSAVVPIFNRALRILLEERRLSPDILDGVSCVVLSTRGQFVPAGWLVLLIGLGEYIRDLALKRFEKVREQFQSLSGGSAWFVDGTRRTRLPLDEIPIGSLIVVYAGETVPLDGRVTAGSGVVATAKKHKHLRPGSKVESDSVLLEGKIYVRRSLSRAKSSLKSAIASKKQGRALYRTRFQSVSLERAYRAFGYLVALAVPGLMLTRSAGHALTLLCFDLVTGVRIAIPSVVLNALHRAGRRGILIKNGASLERLAEVETVIFAASGTVTKGYPDVTEVIPLNSFDEQDVVRFAAAAEHRYYHPAARAIWRHARKLHLNIPERSSSLMIGGFGILADVNGKSIGVGNKHFMQMEEIDVSEASAPEYYVSARGDSLAWVSIDKKLAGLVAYKDPVRENVPAIVNRLTELGVKEILLTSGDSAESTARIAREAGIERFIAELSPQEKADVVRGFQLSGRTVAFLGDDVSDELALSQTDLAISMRDSADIARHEANVVLMDDELQQLPDAISLAREAMASAREKVWWISVPNVLGLILSLANRLNPLQGALLNNGSVIAVSLPEMRSANEHYIEI